MAQTRTQAKKKLTAKKAAAKKKSIAKKKSAARKRGEAGVKARARGELRDVDVFAGEGSVAGKLKARRTKTRRSMNY